MQTYEAKMGRPQTHWPYEISFGLEKLGDHPWTLTVELSRRTGRGRETVRRVFSERDLDRLQETLAELEGLNLFPDTTKKAVNPPG